MLELLDGSDLLHHSDHDLNAATVHVLHHQVDGALHVVGTIELKLHRPVGKVIKSVTYQKWTLLLSNHIQLVVKLMSLLLVKSINFLHSKGNA